MDVIIDNLDLYWSALLGTLRLCAWAAVISILLGTVLAAFRVAPVPPLRWVGTAYVTIFRNLPLTVVLFALAFGLPEIGVNGKYFWFGTIGLGLYTAAFVCEALRSGINSVAAGQAEAARSIGLSFGASLRYVVLPQAFRSSVPPLTSVLIAMIKNSAIAGAFGVGGELFSLANVLTSSRGLAALPVLTGVILFYWLLTLPTGYLLGVVERKVAIAR